MFGLVPFLCVCTHRADGKCNVVFMLLIDVFVCMCTHVCESKGGLGQRGEHLKAVLIAALSALWSVPVAYPANNISGVCACVLLIFPWVSLTGHI